MDLEVVNKLFLELSQFATAKTGREMRLEKALKWIAQQPCTMDAEGASAGCNCSETGACATEWCLSCYARVALRGG